MDYDEVASLIEEKRDVTVDFGTSDSEIVPPQKRIEETEQRLGVKLPPSYIWFLKTYGVGTIFGDDIYAISRSFSDQDMFDVASKTIADRNQGFLNDNEIAICTTDFGEQFVMDTSTKSEDGEYPVVRKMGDVRTQVADSFVGFLGRYIGEKIS